MSKSKPLSKIMAMILTVAMIMSMMPISAGAADSTILGDSGSVATPTDAVIVTEFDKLPDEVLFQGYDYGEITSPAVLTLPDILTGTDADDNAIEVEGVTWESDPEFDPTVSVDYPGYVFTPVLPEGYILAEDVEAPVITVFIRPEGGVGIMPLAIVPGHVCAIGATSYATLDLALAAVQSGETIKLLEHITYNSGIVIDGKAVTFDLNNNTLNVVATAVNSVGLDVSSGGQVKLLNPANGALNVSGRMAGVRVDANCKAEVTNASATYDNGIGAWATGANGEITVYGNASATGTDSRGAEAKSGSEITIGGVITVTDGASYIIVGTTVKEQNQYEGSSTKSGHLEYKDGANIVWVKDPGFVAICEIGSVLYDNLSDALSVVNTGETIKLLDNIIYNNGITIDGITVTFNLNGKTLDVSNSAGSGLTVKNSGEVKLLDPANGEFNVTGTSYGVFFYNGGKATVTNATATTDSGVYVSDGGGELTVTGNVMGQTLGAHVRVGGQITIGGTITVPVGAKYIDIGGVEKIQSQYTTLTTKPGYFTYTETASGTVWVRDPSFVAICEIGSVQYSDLTDALSAVNTGETIKLLTDITYNSGITISGKTVTFDLNNNTLNVVATAVNSVGLDVLSGGQVKLLNPANGALNVSGRMAGVRVDASCKAEVTNASATYDNGIGAWATGANGEITVYGDVSATGTDSRGAEAKNGSEITIDGVITVTGGATYITVGITAKSYGEIASPTTKEGYVTYSDSTNTVWVKQTAIELYNSNAATVLTTLVDGDTVKVMENITYNSGITISGKAVTFDLNNNTLNVVATAVNSVGLDVSSGGQVKLLNPANGALNVSGRMAGVRVDANCKAEVTNASATFDNGIGAWATGSNGEITVYGNVSATGTDSRGAEAKNGSEITIEGEISATNGATYITVGTTIKAQGEHEASSMKPDYLEYKDGANIVWVKGTAAPSIAVTSTGLSSLKVGQSVSSASITYTLTNGTYAGTITAANFAVSNLPAGLSAGTATRTSNTVVTVAITGSPTAYNASTATITLPSSIPMANVSGATANITPTGTVTASAVAKGDGAAVSGAPTVSGTPSQSSITITAVTNAGSTGQSVEYAISTTSGSTPASGWQASTTFSGLTAGTTYYVYARTASNTNYDAGTAQRSVGIATADAAAGNVFYIVDNTETEGPYRYKWSNSGNAARDMADGDIIDFSLVTSPGAATHISPASGKSFTVRGNGTMAYPVAISATANLTLENFSSSLTNNFGTNVSISLPVGVTSATLTIKGNCELTNTMSVSHAISTDATHLTIKGNPLKLSATQGISLSDGIMFQGNTLTVNNDITALVSGNAGSGIYCTFASSNKNVIINGSGSLTLQGTGSNSHGIRAFESGNITINELSALNVSGLGTGNGIFFQKGGTLNLNLPNPATITGGETGSGLYAGTGGMIINNTGAAVTFEGGNGSGSNSHGIYNNTTTNDLTINGNINAVGGTGVVGINVPSTRKIYMGTGTLGITNSSASAEVHAFSPLSADGLAWSLTNATFTTGNATDANVSISTAPGASSSIRRSSSSATNVTFTAAQTGGTSDTADSTGIVLTFSQSVTGLTAGNITISNGTGAAVKGTLSGSGTTYTIGLTSVTTQGTVTVNVSNFGGYTVVSGPQTVTIYKGTAPTPTVTSVTVNPSTVSVQKGTTYQFGTTVQGTNNPSQSVTWSVNSTAGSTISATGLLSVAAGETAATLTVTATSTVDNTKSGTATVTVTTAPPPTPTVTSVTVTPSTITLNRGANHSFSAIVNGTNSPGQGVTWSVTGGHAGTDISVAGILTIAANETATTLTVRATSAVDSSKSGTATVTVTQPAPSYTYTVTFMNGNTVHTTKTVVSPATTVGSLPSNPSNGSYTFSGWYTGINGSGAQFTATTPVTSNMTVYAHWTGGGSIVGGDSGGGGGYSPPATTWNISVDKKPDMPTTAIVSITGSVDANGNLSFSVTDAMMKDAIEKAQAEAKRLGKETDGILIEIKVTTTDGVKTMTAKLDQSALGRLNTAGAGMSVNSSIYRFTLDAAAVKELNTQAKNGLTFTATPMTKLSDAAKAAIGNRPVFDFTAKDGNGKTITSYGKGTITRGIKYTAANGEKTGSLFIVKIVDGKVQWIDKSSYDNGWVIWSGDSNSVYGVGYKTPAPAYTDTTGHWAKNDIDFVASRGLIAGTTATTFSPNTAITRATFLMALGKLSGVDVSGYKTSSFTDVPNTNAAMPYIEWAYQSKIVSGIGNNKFAPDAVITRQEMAVMMVNYAKATNYTLPVSRQAVTFADDAKISSWAKDQVKAIQQTGVISGKPNNLFDPLGNATRAEASAILHRFIELVIDEGTARGWVQNDAGQWQYINTNGKAVTGWLSTTDGNKYWFDDKGIMILGKWVQISGKWYYFGVDGKLAVNTTIDGYKVGADGARVE